MPVTEPAGQRPLVVGVELFGHEIGRGPVGAGQRDAGQGADPPPPGAAKRQADPPAVAGVRVEPVADLAGLEPADVDLEAVLGLGCRGGQRREEPIAQHPELQVVEELVDVVALPRCSGEIADMDIERHRLDQLGQLPVADHAGQVLAQRDTDLAADGVDPGDQLIERPVLAHPLGRGLLTHPGDARQVVAGVAAQRREVGVLRRGQVVLGPHLVGGEASHLADPLARVQDGDVVVHQLQGVAVTGTDEHVEPIGDRLDGEGRDDVVGLVAVDHQRRDPQRVEHLLDQRDLTTKVRRRLAAAGLVFAVGRAAKRRAGDVEGDGEMRRFLVPEQVDEHGGEAVHRIGRLAGGG